MSRKTRFACTTRSPWIVAAVCVLLTGCGGSEPPAPPPMNIKVIEVIQRDTSVTMDFVGQTQGSTDIPIRARVQGFLEGMEFREGLSVTKGQLLYRIDPSELRAREVEVEGYVAEAQTLKAKAKADLERIRPLAEMKAVSQQDLDAAVAQYDASIGKLQAAEAQLELARIELSYTEIRAPIDGLIGISEAKVGEFVGASPNPVVLNYVSLIDPIRVRFSINEQEFLRFRRELVRLERAGESLEDSQSGEGIILILADGSIHEHRGRVAAMDASINPATGTFTIEADFANPDAIVLAGQFARVRIVVDRRQDALLIPQRAVSELQGIYRVFVVGQDGTVSQRTVELGPQVGQLWLVESALEAGERVAIEGLLRLREGVVVKPQLVDAASLGGSTASGAEG